LPETAAQRLGSAAAWVRGSHLRQPTNHKARETADLRAHSAVGCNPLLGKITALLHKSFFSHTNVDSGLEWSDLSNFDQKTDPMWESDS